MKKLIGLREEGISIAVPSKQQLQSYVLTCARYDFSVYEKRVLYRLVELAQDYAKDLDFRTGKDLRKVEHTLFDDKKVTMPVKLLLNGENDKNHAQVKKALVSLTKKGFEFEDDKCWQYISVISNPKIDKVGGSYTFTVHPDIWNCCLDFTKGYSKYELVTAMTFKSVYSMRFYELFSGQDGKTLRYGIDHLKEMFGIVGKYRDLTDFVRKVIEPAKRELDECAPFSFDWSPDKDSKIGKKVININFKIYKIHRENSDEVEQQRLKMQISSSLVVGKEIRQYLIDNWDFTEKELRANLTNLRGLATFDDPLLFLSKLRDKSRGENVRSAKAYVMGAINTAIEQQAKNHLFSR